MSFFLLNKVANIICSYAIMNIPYKPHKEGHFHLYKSGASTKEERTSLEVRSHTAKETLNRVYKKETEAPTP